MIYEPKVFGGGCGRSEFSKHHAIAKTTEKSIVQDLDLIDLPEEVKREAQVIFNSMKVPTKRGTKRKRLLFFCINQAYVNLKQPKDPKMIANQLGIKSTDISKSSSMCSSSQTGYKPVPTFYHPIDFIPDYMKAVGLDESCVESVKKLGHEVLQRAPDLTDEYPQVVAAGLLLYYMIIHGITVNRKEFAGKVLRSEMTISKMYKRISEIHNG